MKPIDPDLLYRIVRSLPGGMAQMATALDVRERTIRRWLSGEADIPNRLRPELRALINDNLLKELEEDQGEQPKGECGDSNGSDGVAHGE